MPEISIKISNIADIKRAFSLAPSLMTRELNSAINKAILVIGRDSRRRTPVDTGRLRASTYERFGNLRGEVGTNTEYDTFVHEGTRFMRARPYLRDSVTMHEAGTEVLFVDAVNNVLTQIGKMT